MEFDLCPAVFSASILAFLGKGRGTKKSMREHLLCAESGPRTHKHTSEINESDKSLGWNLENGVTSGVELK